MSTRNWNNMFDLGNSVPGGIEFLNSSIQFNSFDIEGKKQLVVLDTVKSIEEAYLTYSPLAAVVLRMAEMFANGCFEVLNRTTGNYTRGQYKEWDQLLAQPNFLQTRTEFLKQLYTYVTLNGWCYAMPVYPASITDRPSAIFLIPPRLIKIKPLRKLPHQAKKGEKIREVFLCWNGQEYPLDESKLILFKDSAATLINPDTFLPEPRTKYLRVPLSNGIGALYSRNKLINDRGATGILANTGSDGVGPIPLMPDEQEKLEHHYATKYGLTPDKTSSVIITSAALKWYPMTFNVKDLALHEEHVACIKDICDLLCYQYRLLSTGEGATYANAKEDKQSVYQDAIIPQAMSLMEQLNNGLKTTVANVELTMSYSHVPVLQASEKEKGEGWLAMDRALELRFKNGLITRNMWLEKIGEDTQSDPVFDLYIWQMTPEQRGLFITPNNDNDEDKSGQAESGQVSTGSK